MEAVDLLRLPQHMEPVATCRGGVFAAAVHQLDAPEFIGGARGPRACRLQQQPRRSTCTASPRTASRRRLRAVAALPCHILSFLTAVSVIAPHAHLCVAWCAEDSSSLALLSALGSCLRKRHPSRTVPWGTIATPCNNLTCFEDAADFVSRPHPPQGAIKPIALRANLAPKNSLAGMPAKRPGQLVLRDLNCERAY